MTTATLGLVVESSSVVAATPALDRMTAASQKAEAAAGQLGRASSGASTGMRQLEVAAAGVAKASAVMNSARGNTANIAAQFQDIAVSAQAGMGALQIGLQQGTQLAAVISTMENPIKGLGAAFASVLSPISLLVIGITALAAAGLQMVDWTAVAKVGLNAVADALVVIAPYAVVAATGLALLYAPTIISGAVSLVLSLGNVAKGIWGIATAIYATVGLPVLLVAGFVALVAAAILWRDDLTKMLGFDIVKAAQDGLNWIIGGFVGAFNAIKAVWNSLPAVIGDAAISAANNTLTAISKMINGAIEGINGLVEKVPSWLGGGQKNAIAFRANEGPAFENPFQGAMGAAGDVASKSMKDAQGIDYVGQAVTFVKNAASGAADALHGLADTLKDKLTPAQAKAIKEAERQKKAYDDITLSAHQKIAASELEMQTIGMTTEQINAQKYAQELLNKAANDNIKLTGKQVDELTGLGAALAAAEAAAKALRDVYEFGKETFNGFFSDFKSGIEEGKSLWDALGEAGLNALNKIADKALSMAADGLFDMIFGAFKGSLFGSGMDSVGPGASFGQLSGFLQNAKGNVFTSPSLSAYSGGVFNSPQTFAFARGAGVFAEAGPEAIMPLKRTASGSLGVQVANSNAANGGRSSDMIHIVLQDDSGRMAGIADQQIKTASGVIVSLSVKAGERNFLEKASKGDKNYRAVGVGAGTVRR